jgi:hypothetical protein
MAPPARTSQAGALRVLDLRVVDATMRDRHGHAPRRALTQDELEELAPSFDVVADDMAAQPDGTPLSAEDIATLHRAHPGIRVVRVLETLTSNDPAYPGIRPDDGVHSDWFLTDGAGQPALVYGGNAAWNGEPNFALDPASEGVRLAIAARARQYMLLGYDGVWLAGIRTAPPLLASGEPHHRGGERYGPAEWREAAAGIIAAARGLAPGAAIYVDKADADAAFAEGSGAIAADR